MRSNGDGGERFLARVSASEGPDEMDEVDARERNRHDESIPHEPRPSAMPAAAAVKVPKGSKPRRSQAPKSIAKAPATDAPPKARADGGATANATDKSSKKPPAKRPKAKPAAAPSVRSQRASVPAPRSSRPSRKPPAPKEAPAPISALAKSLPPPPPPSLDPRTTLRDHPLQKSLASTVRASYPPGVAPPSRPARSVREDGISIPPTTTHETPADLDDHFFAQGEAAAQAAAFQSAARIATARPDHGDPSYEAAHRAVHVPPERRRKLTNYVKAAVGLSAVLCLAALVRVGVVHANSATERSVASSPVVAAVTTAPVAAPPAPVVVPPPPPVVAETAPAPAALPAAVVAEVAPAASAVAESAAPAAEPVAPAKSAKQEKESARAALEHGKRKDAVEAGERSVALDPTDAEAWLLLGSAQQDSGHWKDAHESFVSCTKQAKVGPIGECRMMLR